MTKTWTDLLLMDLLEQLSAGVSRLPLKNRIIHASYHMHVFLCHVFSPVIFVFWLNDIWYVSEWYVNEYCSDRTALVIFVLKLQTQKKTTKQVAIHVWQR